MSENEIYDEVFEKMDHFPRINEFYDCEFKNNNFQENSLAYKIFSDCEFTDCNMSVVSVQGSTFRGCKFKNCKLVGINWSSVSRLEDVCFENCILTSSIMMNLDLRNFSFKNSLLKEVDFSEANLQKAKFDECDLKAAVFRDTDLSFADLSSAINYDIDSAYNKLKKAKFSLPEAVSLLKGLGIDLI